LSLTQLLCFIWKPFKMNTGEEQQRLLGTYQTFLLDLNIKMQANLFQQLLTSKEKAEKCGRF